MKTTTKMSRAVSQLEHMTNAINQDYFGGELPPIIVTVQSKPGTFGHSSVTKVWKRKDEQAYELNVAAEVLSYPIEETIDTIIHEAVHIYCREHGIAETSRNGSYHNKRFKEVAEAHGLTCIYTGSKYGWNTTPNDKLIEYALQKDWSEIQINRGSAFAIGLAGSNPTGAAQTGDGGKAPSSTRKLQCPGCGNSVRATKKVNILCGDCMKQMVEV